MLNVIQAAKLFIIFLLCGLAGWAAASQETPEVLVPPPAIEFDRWRSVRETESWEKYQVTFPSAMVTRYEENNSVRLDCFVPTQRVGRAPVVILLHFWGATDQALEEEMATELARKGIASILMPLPYHLSRTPKGTRSGELAIVADPDQLRKTLIQSVWDLRRAVDFIGTKSELDPNAIGLTGTSLGAIVSSLGFAVEPRFKCGAFMLGGADLAAIMWNSSRVGVQREQLRAQGFTEEIMREQLRDVEPLTYLRKDDLRPSYLISARHDNVVPKVSSQRLRDALGNAQELTLETGHYGGFLVREQLLKSVASFLTSTLRGQQFSAPSSFYSPTIRFALILEPTVGLQVGAGLDLWRLNETSDAFAAGFLTPRGLRGYFGFQLGGGVSMGITLAPQRVNPALVWSTVF